MNRNILKIGCIIGCLMATLSFGVVASAETNANEALVYDEYNECWWDESDSPYIVTEDLVIEEGKSLIIDGDVEVIFEEGTSLTVLGYMNCLNYTDGSKPTFTSETQWDGIIIDSVVIDDIYSQFGGDAIIKNAKVGITCKDLGCDTTKYIDEDIEYCYLSDLTIEGCDIGVLVEEHSNENAEVTIDSSRINNNRIGVSTSLDDTAIYSCEITNNEVGIYDNTEDDSSVDATDIHSCLIKDNNCGVQYTARCWNKANIKTSSLEYNYIDSNKRIIEIVDNLSKKYIYIGGVFVGETEESLKEKISLNGCELWGLEMQSMEYNDSNLFYAKCFDEDGWYEEDISKASSYRLYNFVPDNPLYNCILIEAQYDEDGILLDISTTECDGKLFIDHTRELKDGTAEIKVFLWKSLESGEPLNAKLK